MMKDKEQLIEPRTTVVEVSESEFKAFVQGLVAETLHITDPSSTWYYREGERGTYPCPHAWAVQWHGDERGPTTYKIRKVKDGSEMTDKKLIEAIKAVSQKGSSILAEDSKRPGTEVPTIYRMESADLLRLATNYEALLEAARNMLKCDAVLEYPEAGALDNAIERCEQ